jgi:hypothetical protein
MTNKMSFVVVLVTYGPMLPKLKSEMYLGTYLIHSNKLVFKIIDLFLKNYWLKMCGPRPCYAWAAWPIGNVTVGQKRDTLTKAGPQLIDRISKRMSPGRRTAPWHEQFLDPSIAMARSPGLALLSLVRGPSTPYPTSH